jgi:ABC-type multidrug transport system fused ATPase/permease subunit
MVDSVLNTKIKFFEENTHGRILNRFSKDIETLDRILFTFLDMIDVIFKTLNQFSVHCEMCDNSSHHYNIMLVDVDSFSYFSLFLN